MGAADWIVDAVAFTAREALLFAAIGFLVGGVDDLAVDFMWLRERLRGRLRPIAAAGLPSPARPMAIFVPAWDESAVIGAMLAHMAMRLREPDLTIFVGTYPNDPATIDAVAGAAERDARIRLVVLRHAGPTTKADCLNGLWHALRRDEWRNHKRYAGVILHDAEDIVHPLELRVLGAMLVDHHAAQLPVHPLPVPGSPLISGDYCDEFAEAHAKQMPVRDALGTALPLAGVGCAIRRDVLASIARQRDGDPFDAASLTEDYELGFAVARDGGRVCFARALDGSGKLVSVRAYFPASIDAAVRQKARWMTGIALAGWDRTGWGARASLAEWWMRMRDRRAILAVMTLISAYVGLLLTGILLGMAGDDATESFGSFEPLLFVTSALLLWRITMRTLWVSHAYDRRTALLALPRLIVGNIIAMLAARRAVGQYWRLLRGQAPRWDKTAHHFPSAAEILG